MSIRRRLLVWLLSGMLLAGLAVTLLVFYQARSTANEMFDYQLKQIAMALRDRAYLPQSFGEKTMREVGRLRSSHGISDRRRVILKPPPEPEQLRLLN